MDVHNETDPMRIPHHLRRSSCGVFYFRQRVPLALREQIGRAEIIRSLHTRDPREAARFAYTLADSTARVLHSETRESMGRKFDLNDPTTWGDGEEDRASVSRRYEVADEFGTTKTDGSADDHARAMEYQRQRAADRLALEQVKSAAPRVVAGAPAPEPSGEKMGERIAARIAEKEAGKKDATKWYEGRSTLGALEEWAGSDRDPATFTNADAVRFREHMRGLKKPGRGLPVAGTITKKMSVCHSFFDGLPEVCRPRGNPFTKISGHARGKKRETMRAARWRPFDGRDLRRIFDPARLLRVRNPSDFWLPCLGLFLGGRAEELAALRLVDITTDPDAPGRMLADITPEASGTQKSAAAERTLPLPDGLVALGFLDYLADIKKRHGPKARAFPDCVPNAAGSRSSDFSKRFGRYLTTCEITHPKKVFHSFRSTLAQTAKTNAKARGRSVGREVREAWLGQNPGNVHDDHYDGTPENFAVDLLPFLVFPINLAALRYKPGDLEKWGAPDDPQDAAVAALVKERAEWREKKQAAAAAKTRRKK